MLSPARLQQELEENWLLVPEALELLGRTDKGWLCRQLRDGVFPGAFRLGDHKQAPWLIPRAAVEAYPQRIRMDRNER